MQNIVAIPTTKSAEIAHFGWRYYNKIKKKAMEQEFSWSGFFLSMSIAFFIVILAASLLSFLHFSVSNGELGQMIEKSKIYRLEGQLPMQKKNFLQIKQMSQKSKINFSYFT